MPGLYSKKLAFHMLRRLASLFLSQQPDRLYPAMASGLDFAHVSLVIEFIGAPDPLEHEQDTPSVATPERVMASLTFVGGAATSPL